ncbi:MAG: anti-sigma factor antagonist [Actinomycetota bacterium]|jgi:anti-sigma B factor antagonist
MAFSIDGSTRGGHAVLTVLGDIDTLTAPRLRERLMQLLDEDERRIVIDLEGVRFLDSSALSVFVSARKHMDETGGELTLVCSQPTPRRVFEVTGLDQVFTIVDSLDAATRE